MIYLKFFILSACIFLFSGSIPGQNSDIKFKHLTIDNGLSQNWVKAICQDQYGFMWFGTGGNGLNRYDGYNFKIYRYNPKNPHSISNNWINAIHLDKKRRLWVGTQSGVNLYDNEKDRFDRFPALQAEVITGFYETADGILYVVTFNNIYQIDFEKKIVIPFCTGYDNCFTSLLAGSVARDYKGNIWVASDNGLYQIGLERRTIRVYKHDGGDPKSISDNEIQSVYTDSKGRTWVGTVRNGLNLIAYEDKEPHTPYFIKFTHNPADENSLGKGNIWTMHDDGNGQLWISVVNASLDILDLNALEKGKVVFKHYKTNAFDSFSLSNYSINAFYQDKQGTMWVGTYNGGVDYYNKMLYKFQLQRQIPNIKNSLNSNAVNVFFEEGDDLWVGTEGGLDIINRKTGEFTHFVHNKDNPSSIGSNAVWAIFKDSRNNIWLGTWDGGLNLYNRKTRSFKRFLFDRNNPKSISSNNIFGITEDVHGNLWIANMSGGLNKYDYRTNEFTNYKLNVNSKNSISGNWVQAILETSNHELWLASSDGVDLFNRQTGIFKTFRNDASNPKSINYNGANVIFEDSRKNIWIGTDGGLNLFIRKDSSFIYYREENGLPNNSIKAICEDDRGSLWLSTNNGISKFINAVNDPFKPSFKNYDKSDGLQDNEFNRRSSFKDKNGVVYFGGIKGFNYFHPDSLKENNTIPEVFITEFFSFNKPVEIGASDSLLKQNINITKELVLNHGVSVLGFQFATLNYIASEKNQYAYILEGFEKEWNYAGNKREVTYTNLNPGTYTFRVKASNNDGVWNEKGVALKIVILPPWWATIWFRLLVILALTGMVMLYIYVRTRNLRVQKKILEEKVHERTSSLSEVTALLEEKQQEILTQNEELMTHRETLEVMVKERTADMEKAMKKAEEADRLKTAFLANMSHEIRTPMNSIVGFSSLLDNDEFSRAEKKEFTNIIHKNCDSLQVLINDIIEVSLIESNQLTLVKTDFELIAILKELESFFRMKNEKNLDIRFVPGNALTEFWLHSDPVRFRQIISNLLDNAVKYTEKGYVHFGFKVSGNFIEFNVSDSGIGIPKEEYDNVFNHFYKIETDTTRLFRGAGIGLSICNRLVKMLGGIIWVESEIGKGTTFYFTLPNEKTANKGSSGIPLPNEDLVKLNSVSILIVEDEENNSILLKRLLEIHGAKTIWAKNGKEAVDMVVNNFRPDLILMDIKMPVMDGAEATKIIRARFPYLPIIAVTAYTLESEKDRYMSAGFTDYISKPIDVNNFVYSIKKWLK